MSNGKAKFWIATWELLGQPGAVDYYHGPMYRYWQQQRTVVRCCFAVGEQ